MEYRLFKKAVRLNLQYFALWPEDKLVGKMFHGKRFARNRVQIPHLRFLVGDTFIAQRARIIKTNSGMPVH
jgi:hypothetical protein